MTTKQLVQTKKMKKSPIYLALTSVVFSSAALAAPTPTDDMENIVVTASRTQQDKFDVLAAIDVFDRDAIEEIQPLSVTDLLNQIAGIAVVTQGTSAHESSAFVRGANSDHVLVLVNGVRVGSATLGEKSLSSIPVQLIERVEVVRGPRAALWGADAMAGVIQIFTRELAAGEGQVGVKVGSNNLYQGYGAIGLGNEQHNYTLSASVEASDGYDVIKPDPNNPYAVDQPDDDGYDRQAIALKGMSKFSDTYQLEVNAQYDQGTTEIDANTAYSGDENSYENYSFLLRNHVDLGSANLQLSLSTSQDKSHDNYSHYVEFSDNLFKTTRDQLSALVEMPMNEQTQFVVGGDWYKEKVSGSNVYDVSERNVTAVFATARHQLEQLKLEASLRYDDVEKIDSEATYQLGAGYELSDNWLVVLSHGTAFKAPTFNDLYYPYSGNPDLVSETAQSTELLTRFSQNSFSVEFSVYQTDYDNLIEWAQVDPSDPYNWKPFNVAKATIKGAEATISADILGLQNRLTLSHVDAEDKASGSQLNRRPYFTSHYRLTYPSTRWQASLDINYQGSRKDSGLSMDSYTLVDISASYELNSQLNLLAKIANLTDKEYQAVNQYQGQERTINLTLDYRF